MKTRIALLTFTVISTALIIFQKYIYEWFAQLAPSPIYKVVVWVIIAFHVLGLLILVVGSIFAILGKLIQKPLLLWVYFLALHLMLFGTVFSFILGVDCFLTALEKVFRLIAEMPGYRGGFIAYYLSVIGINITGINISIGFTILFAVALVRIFMQGKNMVKINVLIAFILLAGSVGLAYYRIESVNSGIKDTFILDGQVLEVSDNKVKITNRSGGDLEFSINDSTYFLKEQLGDEYPIVTINDLKVGDRVSVKIENKKTIYVQILGALND